MVRRGIVVLALSVASCAAAPSTASCTTANAVEPSPTAVLVLPVEGTPWTSGPESAVKVAHLYGEPEKAWLFVQRMQMPAGAKTPPHWHTHDELITVLSGSIFIGAGDVLDESAAKEITAGGLVVIPARSHHFGGSKGGAVLQVQGVGPFEMNWLASR
jgi:quercetin dioxygenase-like cupin family protein